MVVDFNDHIGAAVSGVLYEIVHCSDWFSRREEWSRQAEGCFDDIPVPQSSIVGIVLWLADRGDGGLHYVATKVLPVVDSVIGRSRFCVREFSADLICDEQSANEACVEHVDVVHRSEMEAFVRLVGVDVVIGGAVVM